MNTFSTNNLKVQWFIVIFFLWSYLKLPWLSMHILLINASYEGICVRFERKNNTRLHMYFNNLSMNFRHRYLNYNNVRLCCKVVCLFQQVFVLQLNELDWLLETIKVNFPKLTYLSLLGNAACPNQLSSHDNDEEDYIRYRWVLYWPSASIST